MRQSPEIIAFTADQVSRLTGLARRRLKYWHVTGFFRAEYETDSSSWAGLYSFRDLVGLDTVAALRRSYKVPLQELRRVAPWLHEKYQQQTPWSAIRFFVSGKKLLFQEPGGKVIRRPLSGQQVAAALIDLEEVARRIRKKIEHLRKRPRQQVGRVERTRRIVHNLPVIAGTRIPTIAVWELHAAGYTTSRIRGEFPSLTRKDVIQAIEYETNRQIASKAS